MLEDLECAEIQGLNAGFLGLENFGRGQDRPLPDPSLGPEEKGHFFLHRKSH